MHHFSWRKEIIYKAKLSLFIKDENFVTFTVVCQARRMNDNWGGGTYPYMHDMPY